MIASLAGRTYFAALLFVVPNVCCAQEIVVAIMVTPEIQPNKQVLVSGQSNLPNGTKLSIRIEDAFTGDSLGTKFLDLENGTFKSELFGNNAGLKDGDYIVSVSSSMPRAQTESVRKLIGENGENLAGPLVIAEETFGTSVNFELRMGIGGPESFQKGLSRLEEDVRNYREINEKITALFKGLESAYKTKLLNERSNIYSKDWGIFIDHLQADRLVLKSRIDKIENSKNRIALVLPLAYVVSMSHEAAFRKDGEYAHFRSEYVNAMREYEELIGNYKKVIEKANRELSMKTMQSTSREWADISGKFRVDATMVGMVDENIMLKKSDGKEITIPISKLSKQDQDFIKQFTLTPTR